MRLLDEFDDSQCDRNMAINDRDKHIKRYNKYIKIVLNNKMKFANFEDYKDGDSLYFVHKESDYVRHGKIVCAHKTDCSATGCKYGDGKFLSFDNNIIYVKEDDGETHEIGIWTIVEFPKKQ